MPVPGGGINENLAVLEPSVAQDSEQGEEQRGDAEEQVGGVRGGEDGEEVSAHSVVGALRFQFEPSAVLTEEEAESAEEAEEQRGYSATAGAVSEAEPFFDGVGGMEDSAAGEFEGGTRAEDDGGV